MSEVRIQGEAEKRLGIYYAIDSESDPIGVGGMGKVYAGTCVNEKTGVTRPVAIKFIYDDLQPENAHVIERARREASIRLRNDNIVEMLGFIETQDVSELGEVKKHYHVISELLTGVSLSDVLDGKTTDNQGHPVAYAQKMLESYRHTPEKFAKEVVSAVLSGLAALHDAGYVHRDIDPTNIMLTADGHIKLIDFGIAKQVNTLTTNDRSFTVSGKFIGKAKYAAPELALGDIAHQNQTTDIYAMGILLFELVCGHLPFDGPTHEVLQMQIKSKMPLNEVSNPALRKIIGRATEKSQDKRYQSAFEFRVALDQMKAQERKQKQSSGLWNVVIPAVIAVAGLGLGFLMGQVF